MEQSAPIFGVNCVVMKPGWGWGGVGESGFCFGGGGGGAVLGGGGGGGGGGGRGGGGGEMGLRRKGEIHSGLLLIEKSRGGG